MKVDEAVRQRIKELMERQGIETQYKLFKNSGVPKSTVHSILCGRTQNIGVETIFAIAQGFGIGLREFFDCDTFNNENIVD